MTKNIPTPDFQEAAYTAFVDGLGAEALESFRELVRWFHPGAATMQATGWLNLSDNDQKIFRAVDRSGATSVTDFPFTNIRDFDPLNAVSCNRVYDWAMTTEDGRESYRRISQRVRDEGAMAVMLRASEEADGDLEMFVTWCLAMKAKRELTASN
jgi:hypothetical protein